MKFKSYLLAAALLLGGAGAAAVGTSVTLAADEPAKVDALAEGQVFKITGTLKNYPDVRWGSDTVTDVGNLALDQTYVETTDNDQEFTIYYADVVLAVGDQFKIVVETTNADGAKSIDWVSSTCSVLPGITGGENLNFVVQEAGRYRIGIHESANSSWGYGSFTDGVPQYNPYRIEKLPDASKFTVTYIGPDGNEVLTDVAHEGVEYATTWFLIDGYVNVQWYVDEDRTEPYAAQILTEDTILYGKGDVAPEDRVIYYEGDKTYFHAWHDQFSEGTAWPGLPIAENSEIVTRKWDTEATVYKITIPGEYLADKIIFNNPDTGFQTGNLDIVDVEGLAVYDDNGYNNVKSAALEFITMFDTLRQDGNICYLLSEENKADLETIVEGYNSLPEGAHALIDGVEDIGAARDDDKDGVMTPAYCTIGETMNYLLINSGVDVTTTAGFIESFEKNASDWIAIVSIAAVSVAAAGLFFFIRKKKSAK